MSAEIVPLPEPEPIPEPALDPWEVFWVLYPRKVAKLEARKAWAKVSPADYVAICEALVIWRAVWRDKDPEYLPHPASWLRGERWTDEPPFGFAAAHLSHMQAKAISQDGPSEMPEKVKLLFAKLKERR